MQFTVVDAGVAVITLLSGILAYSRGLTREFFAIAGWVAAAVAAYYAAPMLEPLIRELPVVGKFLAASCVISMIAAFTVVVAVVLMILSIFTPMIAGLVLDSALGPLDRMLGFVFGVARGLVLIAIVFLIYTHYSGAETWPPLNNAASKAMFEESAALIEQNLPPSIFDWLGERMETLMVNCSNEVPGAGTPEATDLPATGSGAAPETGNGSTDAGTGTGAGSATDTTTTGN